MAHKTKATAMGRQWVNTKLSERITNNATFAAGGQCIRFAPMTPGLTEGHFGECTGLLIDAYCSCDLMWPRNRVDFSARSFACSASLATSSSDRSSDALSILARPSLTVIFLGSSIIAYASLWLLIMKRDDMYESEDVSSYSCFSSLVSGDDFQVYMPIFVRLWVLRNSSRWKFLTFSCSAVCVISCAICCANSFFRLGMVRPLLTVLRRSSSYHGADSDYSGSLALWRWRYSTSRFNAAVTNCPVLSPGIFTASTLSITSCGTLAATVCDFAFTAFVAMWCTPQKKQMQYAGKKIGVQHLTCSTPVIKLVFNTLLVQGAETTKPGSALTLTGLLTTNDSESIEVAMRNHTTHPQVRDSHNLNKFTWRFIALSTAQPRVIHIEATSEQEARQQSPAGCVMVFAARIRQEAGHVQ